MVHVSLAVLSLLTFLRVIVGVWASRDFLRVSGSRGDLVLRDVVVPSKLPACQECEAICDRGESRRRDDVGVRGV